MKLRKFTGGILICMIFAAAILSAAGAAETETTATTEETAPAAEETTTAAPIEEETTTAAPAAEETTTEDPDLEAENLYARRMQYAQDVMLQDAYNLRLQYSSEVSEQYSVRNKVVDYALSFVGVTPYVPGGMSLWWGTDCSGFLQLIYGAFGYWLPSGSASYQYYVGKEVSWAQIQPGDILVYDWGEHVGIYAGDGMLVHCSSPENGTVVWPCNYRLVTRIVSVLPDPEPIEPAK